MVVFKNAETCSSGKFFVKNDQKFSHLKKDKINFFDFRKCLPAQPSYQVDSV
jgi:hypothetical protein